MKSVEELRRFYETTLQPELDVLEQKRKAAIRKIHYIGLVFLLLAGLSTFLFREGFDRILPIAVICLLIGFVLWDKVYEFFEKPYAAEINAKVIQKSLHFIEESLTYSPKEHICEEDFIASQIFQGKHDKYTGAGLISGRINGTPVQFSLIKSLLTATLSGCKRISLSRFSGLFFVIRLNRSLPARTVVIGRRYHNPLGTATKILQPSERKRDPVVKIDYPEFEQYFVALGNDSAHTKTVLSTKLVRKVIDFRRNSDSPVFFSVMNSCVYGALLQPLDPFRSNIFRSLSDLSESICNYHKFILFSIEVVEALKANPHIWARQ